MTNKNNKNNTSSGLGFWGALQIAFIVLKLCGVINWSWLWVLSPMWIGSVLGAIIVIIYIWLIS